MSEETREQEQQEKGGSKKRAVIYVLVLLVIAAIIVAIVYLLKPEEKKDTLEPETTKRPVVVTEDNMKEILTNEAPSAPKSYDVVMKDTTWRFHDGKTASDDSYVENSEDNETAVYFDVIRNDTQERIYQSPVIPLGGHVDNIVLDKDLDAGNYDCTMVYHLVDEEQNTLTTVKVALVILVEN